MIATLLILASLGDWGEPLVIRDYCYWIEVRTVIVDGNVSHVAIFWSQPDRSQPLSYEEFDQPPVLQPWVHGTVKLEFTDGDGVLRRIIAWYGGRSERFERVYDYHGGPGLTEAPKRR